MDCQDFDQLLHPYLDGEFGPAERLEVDDHLSGCPACAQRAQVEAKFRDVVRSKASPLRPSGPKASSGLKRSIMAGLRKEQRRSTQQQILKVSAVAAVALFTGGAFALLRPQARNAYVDDAALRHSRGLPMEIRDATPEEYEAWFGGKLDHRVPIPHLANATMTGARLSNVKERPAAYIRYEAPSPQSPSPHRVGLFVFGDAERALEAPVLPSLDLEQHRGYNVAIWRDGEIVYQLVSDLEEADIRRMVTAGSVRRSPAPELNVQPASLQR